MDDTWIFILLKATATFVTYIIATHNNLVRYPVLHKQTETYFNNHGKHTNGRERRQRNSS